jgi:hypothetical protein
MTRDAAVGRAAGLNREERGGRHWFVQETAAGDYDVVAVTAPGLRSPGKLTATVVSKPKPSEAPDPRPSLFRNVPPYGAG